MKKGIFTVYNPHVARCMTLMNIKWFHTGLPTRESIESPYKFIPIIPDESKMTTSILSSIRKSSDTIIGFTNPEMQMSPEYCANVWQIIQNTKLLIGSPCFSDYIWMNQFMALVRSRKLKVDFTCAQWYGLDKTVKGSLRELKMGCLKTFMEYDKPVWLTRFACNPKMTRENKLNFIQSAVDLLDSLPYVHRYAWDNLTQGTNALVDSMGYPNDLGLAYAGTEGFNTQEP